MRQKGTRHPALAAGSVAALAVALLTGACGGDAPGNPSSARPNIILAIADDWSYPHATVLGDTAVRTPVIDRVAREGATFTYAFAAAPSCSASRAAILTGQHPHRLEEGSQLWGFLPAHFPVYPELLQADGYHAGSSRKGWGPGPLEPAGRTVNPAGARFEDFDAFMDARPPGAPFVYWFGTQDPHRPYDPDSGVRSGIDLARIEVPPYLPDTPAVRADIADYLFEVERFDRELGGILARLGADGELDQTVVVVTSDNGMPFPRAKATVYDGGTRVPLMIRWPGVAPAGLVSDAMINLVDLAPTFLAAAGLEAPAEVTGRDLRPLLRGQPGIDRDRVFLERERHANVRRGDLGYPVRAVRTYDYLYVRNLRPDRWPAGDPETYVAVGPFGDIDGGPTKDVVLDRRLDPAIAPFFGLATAKRPAEELYALATDPHQVNNVATNPAHASALAALRQSLDAWMRDTADPRATEDDDRWEQYPYYGGPAAQEAR